MRNTKKAISILLTLLMVVGMMSTFAFAQSGYAGTDTDGATITISKVSKGQTYTLYQIFDAKVSANNTITYQLMSGKKDVPLPGFKVEHGTITIDRDFNTNKLTEAEIAKLEDYGTNIGDTVTSDDGSNIVYTGLSYGYYLVATNNGTLVSLNSTTPNVTIEDKNFNGPNKTEDPVKSIKVSDGNYVTEKDVYIGEKVTYRVKFLATNYDANGNKITEYVVNDTLPDFIKKPVTVNSIKIGETSIGAIKFDANGKINIPWTNENGTFKYSNNSIIEVEYDAVINSNVPVDGKDGGKNIATITYKIGSDEEHSTAITGESTVKTYAIAIQKVNSKKEPLSGAQFRVPFHVILGSDGVYVANGKINDESITDESITDNIVTVNDKGVAIIKGVNLGKHKIKEIVAPDGYTLPSDTTNVEAVKTGETTTKWVKYYDANGNEVSEESSVTKIEITNEDFAAKVNYIENFTGTELPSTGGIGTTIFYLIGAILVIGAGVVFVTRRRMHSDK